MLLEETREMTTGGEKLHPPDPEKHTPIKRSFRRRQQRIFWQLVSPLLDPNNIAYPQPFTAPPHALCISGCSRFLLITAMKLH